MASENKENIQLQYLTCPACDGRGKVGGKICSACSGLGVAAWNGSQAFYFGKEINGASIIFEKLVDGIKKIINVGLFLAGITGFVFAGWAVYDLPNLASRAWLIYQIKDWRLLIFWISLLSDCYLYYRIQRDYEKIKHLPKKKYLPPAAALTPISWDDFMGLPRNKKVDISQYFSVEALQALNNSWENGRKYENSAVSPIHLFIALVAFPRIQIIFSRLGLGFAQLKSRIASILGKQELGADSGFDFSGLMRQIILQSYFLALDTKQKKVGVMELLEETAMIDNEIKEMFYDLDITPDKIINAIAWLRINQHLRENWLRYRRRAILRPKNTMNRAMTAIATPVLDAFSQDLTMLARYGYLFPCIGREKEFEAIFSAMAGGPRRSLILVGHPGVGKNTIIEGLAQRMVAEDVPSFLQDKRLVSLSISKLVSGAGPAEAQDRLLRLITEIRRSGNIILYIGDIHNMVGITPGREGSVDLGDMLSQAMAQNNILVLSTATAADYKRYLEDKSSLDRVLEKINIEEVSGNEAIQILESKANSIEYRHQIFFSYDAIAEAVKLSDRYLHDRFLPEKAVQIMEEVAARVRDKNGANSMISANDIAALISEKTNIPLTEITEEESEKLMNLEERIHQRMIDQEEAVAMVATSLRRARAEMRDIKRPIVNLLFLGPTGVGKTELAKTVAEVYFNNEKNMIRLDMSEYQDKSSLNRLIGAPLGFAGSDSGGYLTEAVRKNPFSLLLLDEIEKAHPEILNIFLQVMDDGRLTDSSGRTIDFTNTIIIATSNAGTKTIQELVKQNVPVEQIKQQLMQGDLNQYFRPEFLNRFDGIIVFKPLSPADVEAIAQLMINRVAADLEAKGIGLQVSPEALSALAQAGFDPEFGARPLRRVIQNQVQDQLANLILTNKVKRRDIIVLEGGGKISIIKAKAI